MFILKSLVFSSLMKLVRGARAKGQFGAQDTLLSRCLSGITLRWTGIAIVTWVKRRELYLAIASCSLNVFSVFDWKLIFLYWMGISLRRFRALRSVVIVMWIFSGLLGPYFPRRHSKVIVSSKSVTRPAVPELNMFLHPSFLDSPKVTACLWYRKTVSCAVTFEAKCSRVYSAVKSRV